MMQRDKFIAFCCTGNTCRSPMAEGIFNKLAQEKGIKVHAVSFGMAAVRDMPPSKNAIEACKEIGVDISGHKARFTYDFQLGDFDKIYCMSEEHAMILRQSIGYPAEKIEVLNVADPYGGGLPIYRMCRDIIVTCVEEIIREYEN